MLRAILRAACLQEIACPRLEWNVVRLQVGRDVEEISRLLELAVLPADT
jgi:hypothetical protein